MLRWSLWVERLSAWDGAQHSTVVKAQDNSPDSASRRWGAAEAASGQADHYVCSSVDVQKNKTKISYIVGLGWHI